MEGVELQMAKPSMRRTRGRPRARVRVRKVGIFGEGAGGKVYKGSVSRGTPTRVRICALWVSACSRTAGRALPARLGHAACPFGRRAGHACVGG
eukprot:2083724-Pleurochrysis_carterae.AAC.2